MLCSLLYASALLASRRTYANHVTGDDRYLIDIVTRRLREPRFERGTYRRCVDCREAHPREFVCRNIKQVYLHSRYGCPFRKST